MIEVLETNEEPAVRSSFFSFSACFAASLFCWYVFTLVSAVYTKKYLNATYDSFTFTLVALAYGAFFKLLAIILWCQESLNVFQEVRKYLSLAVFNVASLLFTNIAINETSVAFIYMIKVRVNYLVSIFKT